MCKRIRLDSLCTDKLHSKPVSHQLEEKGKETTSFVALSVTLAILFLVAITNVGVKAHYDRVRREWNNSYANLQILGISPLYRKVR